jgi:hypothetical protein
VLTKLNRIDCLIPELLITQLREPTPRIGLCCRLLHRYISSVIEFLYFLWETETCGIKLIYNLQYPLIGIIIRHNHFYFCLILPRGPFLRNGITMRKKYFILHFMFLPRALCISRNLWLKSVQCSHTRPHSALATRAFVSVGDPWLSCCCRFGMFSHIHRLI